MRLGLTRRQLGDADGAVEAFQRAIEIDPDNARAHCNLGLVLKGEGHYAEAVVQLKKGDELGTAQAGWTHPSAEWVEEAERLASIQDRLVRIASGEVEAKDSQERIDAARHAHRMGRYASALRLWRATIAEDPDAMISDGESHYYDAACAAVLVADGQGDAAATTPEERATCRRSALEWLRRDLAAKQHIFAEPDYDGDPIRILSFWSRDRDLASVRGDALSALPKDEADAWRELWSQHQAALDRVSGTSHR